MLTVLRHPDGLVNIEQCETNKNRVSIELLNKELYMAYGEFETAYPVDLIEAILQIKGPNYLGDEILRDEGHHVEEDLRHTLLSYVSEESFEGKSILDFGCGSGASTMILSRMFPRSEITGVDLEDDYLSIARLRANYYNTSNLRLILSPSGDSLPDSLGSFDYVVLSAVYEHLLPDERRTLLPRIWELVKPGGILFINQTPHRYSPFEIHTTMLPLVNYLPDQLTLQLARRFSKTVNRDITWEELLRRGIRGGTEREIMHVLRSAGHEAVSLRPNRLDMKDQIDIFCRLAVIKGRPMVSKAVFLPAKVLKALTGIVLVPTICLALRKPS